MHNQNTLIPFLPLSLSLSFHRHSHRASPKQLKLSTSRTGRVVSAVVSAENTVQSGFSGTDGFKLTYLETLKPLFEKYPNLRVIATPNAKQPLLDPLFTNVTYLEPGHSSVIEARNGSTVKVQATAGPVLGPLWQRSENGYLVITPEGKGTLYYEPHCVYNTSSLESERADIVITPGHCPDDRWDLDAKGLLASLVSAEETIESFKELLSKELPDAQVLQPTPGVPLQILLQPNLP